MFLKLISNINYLFYFFCITFVLLILTYIIYKLFLLEADVYMIVEKINNIELEFSGSSSKPSSNSCNSNSKCIYKPKTNDTINLSEMMMNEVFNNTMNSVIEPVKKEVDIIDIDEIIGDIKDNEKETIETEPKVIFDLKKEIINNDTESVVSSSTNQLTKKQLQKLNVDKLKDKCNELELSTEGTKSQLIDRILEEINKDV